MKEMKMQMLVNHYQKILPEKYLNIFHISY